MGFPKGHVSWFEPRLAALVAIAQLAVGLTVSWPAGAVNLGVGLWLVADLPWPRGGRDAH